MKSQYDDDIVCVYIVQYIGDDRWSIPQSVPLLNSSPNLRPRPIISEPSATNRGNKEKLGTYLASNEILRESGHGTGDPLYTLATK